jgi:hypothetical protein
VRPAHRNRALHARELAEQVGAVQLDRSRRAGGGQLGVVLPDRGGDHHLGAGRQVGGVVAHGGVDAGGAQAGDRRRVGLV